MIKRIFVYDNKSNTDDGGHVSITIETNDNHASTVHLAEAVIRAIGSIRPGDMRDGKGNPLEGIYRQDMEFYGSSKMAMPVKMC